MGSSAVSKLKRKEEANLSAIRHAVESSFLSVPDERWLFENRLQLIKLTESAIGVLREVKHLPSEEGDARIMGIVRRMSEECLFVLTESEIISRINAYQKERSYLTVGELLYLRVYFQFVCIDVIANGVRAGTLNRIGDAVRMIFALRDIDFEHIYETVSYSESVLIRDPAGVYVSCDGETKSMYRRKLAEISRRFRMGEYETSKLILKNAEESEPGSKARHVGWHILKYSRHGTAAALYFPLLYVLPGVAVGVLSLIAYASGRPSLFFGALLSFLPLRAMLKRILDDIYSRTDRPDILPRLALDDIPPEGKTLVVYTVSLSGGRGDSSVFERLGTYARAYGNENLGFAVLADLPDADKKDTEKDAGIIAEACRSIDDIKSSGSKAYLFYRGREWSESERRFIGRERKRGAQAEMFSLLSGGASSLKVYGGVPEGYKYVLALDADTEILYYDIKKLIATALHPCCEPVISRGSGYPIVTDGYGIIAPVAQVSLSGADKRCRYTAYRYAYGGRSEYERSHFSAYSYLFGTGSFCGKGLISIDAYMKTIYGAFPRERILSHDTAEGIRLRCGHASDLRVYDGVPRDYMRERSRAHRWMRGDVQALCLLRRGIPADNNEKYKNPVGITGRLMMAEPVLAALTSIVRPAAIILSLIGGGLLGFILFLSAVSDRIYNTAKLFAGCIGVPWRQYFSGIPNYYRTSAFDIFFNISSVVDSAANSADAVYRAFYRMRFSKRHLLEWKTAASADGDGDGDGDALSYVHSMWCSILLGIAAIPAALISDGLCSFILPIYGFFWLTFPLWMHKLCSSAVMHASRTVPTRETLEGVRCDIEHMWRFFHDNVTEKYNYLPPDNMMLQPEMKIAERTSPTNIGLYLLSAVNVYDLGIINESELGSRIRNTLKTVSKLEKWNGHLYNWYDIKTLDVLYPAYVSTVDSGNFIVCLLTIKNAVAELPGFEDIIKKIDSLILSADISALYNKKRNLFYIGFNCTLGEYDKNVYDLYSGEILTTSFYAAAAGLVPGEHMSALGRIWSDEAGVETMLSWSGSVFEYFMPAIFLPSIPGTARYEALAAANFFQRSDFVYINGREIYGRSESSFYDFDDSVNYSYKAHGCDALAISSDIRSENVIAPYSLYLLMQFEPETAKVLSYHRRGELYGKYGFYESVDLTDLRVGDEYGIARLYMSHHIGMSITSAANFCLENINQRRFCSEPSVMASLPMLFESVGINRKRSEDKSRIQARTHIPSPDVLSGTVMNTDSAIVSNGRTKIVAKKNGGITVYDGQTLVTQPIRRGCSGIFVLLRIGEEIFSCTSGPRVQFSTDGTAISYVNEFVIEDSIVKTELMLAVSASSPTLVFELTVKGADREYEVLYMFDPVMNKKAAYESAPSYSDLFLTAEREGKDTVKYSKKTGPGERAELTVKVICQSDDRLKLFTRKDDILPFGYGITEVNEIFDIQKKDENGACVHSVFAAVIRCGSEKSGIFLSMGEASEKITADEARSSMEHQLRVNATLAGADMAAVRCAMELSGAIFDDPVHITECGSEINVQYRRDTFWKHGISGDLPIVTVFCSELDASADMFALSELIAAKRFLFVSGVRFDLVLVAPASGYYSGGAGKARQAVRESGSERLLGKDNGIFIIGRETLSAEDELTFIASSCRTVDIGAERGFTLIKNDVSKIPAITETKVGKDPITYKISDDLVTVKNGRNSSPFFMVYANTMFGTLITNISCGYSWYANSAMSTISRRHADPLLGTPGEIVCLTVDDVTYDLARAAENVTWGRDCALFCGNISGIGYELRVGVDSRLPAKLYHLRLEPHDESGVSHIRASLLYYPSGPAVLTRGRVSIMSDTAAVISIFAVSDEIYDSAENAGNLIRCQCAPVAGECGFVIAAYPRGDRCLSHIRDKFRRAEFIPAAFEEYERRILTILPICDRKRGNPFISGMLCFTVYQAVFVRMLARSGYSQAGGAYGYRDQLQDSLSAIYYRPELTKYQILRCCARQYEDGRVQHWWHAFPYGGGLRTHCSDDYMWLPYAVAEYVLATDDTEILSMRAPYLVSPPLGDREGDRYEKVGTSEYSATVLEHCIAAISSSFGRGAHRLPLMGSGDWNDGMNEVGVRGRGESVWLAFFFAVVYRRFSEMLGYTKIDPILSERLMYEADALVSSAELSAWDGGWYIRAFDDNGDPLGAEACHECKIDLLPQAFSVFAGADHERSLTALSSVKSHLFDEDIGIMRLFEPSYDETERHGYICRYPAGIRENGGQYTHAAVWCAAAFFAVGDRKTGEKILSSISPERIYSEGRMNGRYAAEPYFIAADVYYGKGITGKSGWSGYTGSASWFYRIAMKYYYGITISHGAVIMTPPPGADYLTSVRVGGCEVTLDVGPSATPEGSDIFYDVRIGESVTVRPTGEKMKISLKVEK